MGGHINLLIVPEEGAETRRVRIRRSWLVLGGWVLILVLLGVGFAAFKYSRMVQRAIDWSRLASENERLKEENRRIVRVAQEVEQSRLILVKILRSLGSKIDLNQLPLPEISQLPSLSASGGVSDEVITTPSFSQGGGIVPAAQPGEGRIKVIKEEYAPPQYPPLRGFISRRFSDDPLFPQRGHRGVDIAGKEGQPVVAAGDGEVIFEGWSNDYGNCLIIAHKGGYVSFYGHLQRSLKSVPQEVKAGEPIGLVGSTGKSSAPHLHFEIWKDGSPLDPLRIVKF